VESVALRPLRVGEILDVAIKVYRSNFATLVRIVLLVTAPAQILLGLVQASTRATLEPATTDFETIDPVTGQVEFDGGDFAATLVGFGVAIVVTTLMSELASAACFRSVGAAYLGEEQTWRESLRYATKRFWSIVWLFIAKNFVILCGFIACIVPGVHFYAAYGVTTPILMLEGVRGRKAMRRSRDLVKGRWGPVAGVLLLGSILTQIISTAIGGLAAGVIFTDNQVASDVAGVIGGIVGATLTVPILAAIVTVLYLDLRVRKEGFDLELLAETIGVDPSGRPMPTFLPEQSLTRPSDDDDDQPPFWPPPPGWRPKSAE
jgi:hypothetical protein